MQTAQLSLTLVVECVHKGNAELLCLTLCHDVVQVSFSFFVLYCGRVECFLLVQSDYKLQEFIINIKENWMALGTPNAVVLLSFGQLGFD